MACPDCGKRFSSKEEKIAHMERIHGGGQYICRICQIAYKTQQLLDMHTAIGHNLECPDSNCHLVFRNKDELIQHRKNHAYNLLNQSATYESSGHSVKVEPAQDEIKVPFAKLRTNLKSIESLQSEEVRQEANLHTANDAQFTPASKRPGENASSVDNHEASNNKGNNHERGASKKVKQSNNLVARRCNICLRIFSEEDQYVEHLFNHPMGSVSPATNDSSSNNKNMPTISSAVNDPATTALSSPLLVSGASTYNSLIQSNANKKLNTRPVTALEKVPLQTTKWICWECGVHYTNPLDMQIHLSVHVEKMIPPNMSPDCVKLMKEIETSAGRLRELLTNCSNTNGSPSSLIRSTSNASNAASSINSSSAFPSNVNRPMAPNFVDTAHVTSTIPSTFTGWPQITRQRHESPPTAITQHRQTSFASNFTSVSQRPQSHLGNIPKPPLSALSLGSNAAAFQPSNVTLQTNPFWVQRQNQQKSHAQIQPVSYRQNPGMPSQIQTRPVYNSNFTPTLNHNYSVTPEQVNANHQSSQIQTQESLDVPIKSEPHFE